MQQRWPNTWSRWLSSLRMMISKTTMTMTRSHSSRSAIPRPPSCSLSLRCVSLVTGVQMYAVCYLLFKRFGVCVLFNRWTFLIRHLDLQMEALMRGELLIFELIIMILIPAECDWWWFLSGRDLQIESLKSELELLRAELEKVKTEVRILKYHNASM